MENIENQVKIDQERILNYGDFTAIQTVISEDAEIEEVNIESQNLR